MAMLTSKEFGESLKSFPENLHEGFIQILEQIERNPEKMGKLISEHEGYPVYKYLADELIVIYTKKGNDVYFLEIINEKNLPKDVVNYGYKNYKNYISFQISFGGLKMTSTISSTSMLTFIFFIITMVVLTINLLIILLK